MAKIRLTKGELKRQRDALGQFARYLPTLQLKKQQLQVEILHQDSLLEQKKREESAQRSAIELWAGLLAEQETDLASWILPEKRIYGTKNIAGVEVPFLERLEFATADYDLFLTPLWVDNAINALRELVRLREDILTREKGIAVLRQELRITTQRVNLFEKVKIPQAREAIRLIKIYLGDQMANAVGRSKMAKRKLEEAVLMEAAV